MSRKIDRDRRFPLCVGLAALLFGMGCSPRRVPAQPISVFDSIVTPDLIRRNCKKAVPFAFKKYMEGEKVGYQALFDIRTPGLRARDAESLYAGKGLYYICSIKIEPAKKKKLPFADKPEPYISGFGPHGGGGGLEFTTRDRGYAIAVDLANHMSQAGADPDVRLEQLAIAISTAYDQASY